jgi:hypothetical protein
MMNWQSEIVKWKEIEKQLAAEVPAALQAPQTDHGKATALFQELDKLARACEQLVLTMRNAGAPAEDVAATESVCDRLDALVRGAADRMMELQEKS